MSEKKYNEIIPEETIEDKKLKDVSGGTEDNGLILVTTLSNPNTDSAPTSPGLAVKW